MLTFAIGDIHGRLDKLNKVLDACWDYWMASDREEFPTYVFLGDYVDRGPDSKGVIDRILDLASDDGVTVVTLMGNHEQMMVSGMMNPDSDIMKSWLSFGGDKTIESYMRGVDDALPGLQNHIDNFLAELKVFHDDGKRFFCHAGVDHNKPLAEQSPERMLWGAGSTNTETWPWRYVVHGHIAQNLPRPIPQANHINIDTHAYAGGPLSCAVFDSEVRGPPIALICDSHVIDLKEPA
jgi:serine/threonine protein phosphatase 1